MDDGVRLALDAGAFRLSRARDAAEAARMMLREADGQDAAVLFDANLYVRVPQPDGVPAYAVLLVAETLPAGFRGSVFGVLRITAAMDEHRIAAAVEGHALPSLRRGLVDEWATPGVVVTAS